MGFVVGTLAEVLKDVSPALLVELCDPLEALLKEFVKLLELLSVLLVGTLELPEELEELSMLIELSSREFEVELFV